MPTRPVMSTLERLNRQPISRRIRRVIASWPRIVQGTLAAGMAFWVAGHLFGHHQPFFAPMAALIMIGATSAGRLKRGVELSIGATLGVAVGDLVIANVGSGIWQIMLVVGISLLLAPLVSSGILVSNQMAIGGILIATIMPPGTSQGPERALDALIGSVVGLIIVALIPDSPLRQSRKEISTVLGIASSVLHDVAVSLRKQDSEELWKALRAVRGSQAPINTMIDAAKSGEESITISPMMWLIRPKMNTLNRMLSSVDNAIRNARVLARRAVILTEDHNTASQAQIEIIEELSGIANYMSEIYGANNISEATRVPEVVRRLRSLGARLTPQVAEGGTLSEWMILGQCRSIVVDFLQTLGMSRESAVAVLAPTSSHPAFPPELFDAAGHPLKGEQSGHLEDGGTTPHV